MAGNEYFATRPHASQDRDRIAAGSPLAIMGIFLEALRTRFAPGNGLDVVWRDDVQTTDILIEAGYNVETEARNFSRALYVNRLNTTPTQTVVGDRVGVHLPDHYQGFTCNMGSQITVDCVSNDAGDSAILADIVQHFFIASRQIFEGWYGIHDFGLAEMGQTQPFQHDQAKWSTTVSVAIAYQIRWSIVKIRPLLQDIGMNVQDRTPEEVFTSIAVASLQRGAPVVVSPQPAAAPARTGTTHIQETPALTWVFEHGLGYYPTITVVGPTHYVITPTSVHHETTLRAVISFSTATAGTARAS